MKHFNVVVQRREGIAACWIDGTELGRMYPGIEFAEYLAFIDEEPGVWRSTCTQVLPTEDGREVIVACLLSEWE
jgi:hypothetical protein